MSPTVKKKVAKKKSVKADASNKMATKKKAVKKRVVSAKKTNEKKSAKLTTKPSSLDITPEERWKMVAVAAYHKAEKRNFEPGYELQDWTESENEIDKFLHG